MKGYERFVRTRRPVWDDFERRLDAQREGRVSHDALESLAFLYRQVLHDHGVALERYAGTGAASRLDGLALRGTHALQWDRSDRLPGLAHFFGTRLPRAFRYHLPYLAAALLLFFTSALFGLTLGVARPEVGFTFLGPQAVEGMKQGHLWTESLVTTVPPALSSSRIATNNMSVSIFAWAGGALGGLGTLYVVLLNGLMLGAIVAATLHYGLAGDILVFMSAHGPLELTLILVSAAGGFNLGYALLAADDRPRAEVLRHASREALVLLLGCLPWFLVLGFVESFVSPVTALPPFLKAGLGGALFALFVMLAWNPLYRPEVP
jgi:uncharacterized membrane protein SpoIIM required for sporulation